MGYMRHHAIVVTGFNERLTEAHAKAVEMGCQVSGIVDSAINFYSSFFVAPDGSKEHWDTSDAGDAARDALIEYLRSLRYGDGSSPVDWVEVQFGDDDGDTHVVADSDEAYREKYAS